MGKIVVLSLVVCLLLALSIQHSSASPRQKVVKGIASLKSGAIQYLKKAKDYAYVHVVQKREAPDNPEEFLRSLKEVISMILDESIPNQDKFKLVMGKMMAVKIPQELVQPIGALSKYILKAVQKRSGLLNGQPIL